MSKRFWRDEYTYWRAYAHFYGCAWVPFLGQC
jgi:hypothetical protein